jgi:predicted ester cyclase
MFRFLRFTVLMFLVSSLLMIPGPMTGAAQEATPEAECPVTTPEENEELATMYWEEVWWGDQGKIAEIVAPDEVHHWGIGGDTNGFEEFTKRWNLFFTAFPDLEFTVDQVAAEGDLAATHWTATGTQRGEWQGIAPTNREVTWQGINVFRFACGQIVESWGEADHLGLLSQLGATDIPALLATPAAPAAQAATRALGATPCADDSAETNVATARRWTEEVYNGKDLTVLDDILDPSAIHHGAAFPDVAGVEAIKEALAGTFDSFPDITLTVDDTIADGDLVVVRWSGTGTNDGSWLGTEPTGKLANFTGINIYRFSCGKIVESWSEMDALSVLSDLK